MTDTSAIITAARSWIGTPFKHQRRMRGVGVDCWNLIRAVGEETGAVVITDEAFKPFASYKRVPAEGQLERALDQFMHVSFKRPRAGRVALLSRRPGDDPKHCGIIGKANGRLTLIHAVQQYGGVVEHTLSREWEDRIVKAYRWPN